MTQPQNVQVPDWLARGLRTFVHTFIGVFLLQLLPNGLVPGYVPSTNDLQKAGLAALTAAVVAVLSAVHNGLEDNTGFFPAVLKPSPPAQNPVPKENAAVPPPPAPSPIPPAPTTPR